MANSSSFVNRKLECFSSFNSTIYSRRIRPKLAQEQRLLTKRRIEMGDVVRYYWLVSLSEIRSIHEEYLLESPRWRREVFVPRTTPWEKRICFNIFNCKISAHWWIWTKSGWKRWRIGNVANNNKKCHSNSTTKHRQQHRNHSFTSY